MRNATEKRRDMARSILPCKNRQASRNDLARARRTGRRREKQALGAFAPGTTEADADELWAYDPVPYPNAEINGLVRQRQGSDHLNHFERWAADVTRHLPVADRLGFLRQLLPAGLICDHAISHLRHDEAFGGEPWSYSSAWHREQAERRRQWERQLAFVWWGLHVLVLEGGRHAEFNRAIRAAGADPLRDVHDVERCWRHLAGDADRWSAAVRYLSDCRL